MPIPMTGAARWVGSLITLVIGAAAANFLVQAGPVASLGLGLALATLVFVALSLAARTDRIRGLAGNRLIVLVLVLGVLMAALGVIFWMQPELRHAGALAVVMFTSSAFYIAAALRALIRVRKDRAGS